MNRLVIALLSLLIVLVIGHGFLTWRAAVIAHEDAERQSCIQQNQATALIALVTPALLELPSEIDAEGQQSAIAILGAQVDDC